MRIKKLIRIGKHHANNCEDSVGNYKIGDTRELIAVCDGCSMGDKSHFVSELIQKILREISKEEDYREYGSNEKNSVEALLKSVCKNLFKRLQSIYLLTGSHKYDYLSTVLISIVDYKALEYSCLISGDGILCVDGNIEIFDQNNQPNYIGYYLENNFEEWFGKEVVVIKNKFSESVAISTDGILTFSNSIDDFVSDKRGELIIKELLSYSKSKNEKEIQNVVDDLYMSEGISTTDDLGVVKLEIN